ncbi:hypothetical protein D3C76_912860 [compost metagenome]
MAAGFNDVMLRTVFDVLQRARRDKAVAALGHGDDVALTGLAVAEGFAQGCHVHPQVDLFHHAIGPDLSHQLLLADDLPGVFEQDQQDVHGASAKAQGAVGFHRQTSSRVDPVGAEMHSLFGGEGQRFTPVCMRLGRAFRAYSSGFCRLAMRCADDCCSNALNVVYQVMAGGPVNIGRGSVKPGSPGLLACLGKLTTFNSSCVRSTPRLRTLNGFYMSGGRRR